MADTTKTTAEQLQRANRAVLIWSQTPRNQYSTELCDMLGESLRAALEQLAAATAAQQRPGTTTPEQVLGFMDAVNKSLVDWLNAFTKDRCDCFFETATVREWAAQLMEGKPYVPGPGDAELPVLAAATAAQQAQERIADLQALGLDMLAALRAARGFIVNGVELGFIRMPDADTPDTAHNTLPMIEAAIARATSESAAATAAQPPQEPADNGPWTVERVEYPMTLTSADFEHDVTLKVSGDFGSDEARHRYAQWLVGVLNAAGTQGVSHG